MVFSKTLRGGREGETSAPRENVERSNQREGDHQKGVKNEDKRLATGEREQGDHETEKGSQRGNLWEVTGIEFMLAVYGSVIRGHIKPLINRAGQLKCPALDCLTVLTNTSWPLGGKN